MVQLRPAHMRCWLTTCQISPVRSGIRWCHRVGPSRLTRSTVWRNQHFKGTQTQLTCVAVPGRTTFGLGLYVAASCAVNGIFDAVVGDRERDEGRGSVCVCPSTRVLVFTVLIFNPRLSRLRAEESFCTHFTDEGKTSLFGSIWQDVTK